MFSFNLANSSSNLEYLDVKFEIGEMGYNKLVKIISNVF